MSIYVDYSPLIALITTIRFTKTPVDISRKNQDQLINISCINVVLYLHTYLLLLLVLCVCYVGVLVSLWYLLVIIRTACTGTYRRVSLLFSLLNCFIRTIECFTMEYNKNYICTTACLIFRTDLGFLNISGLCIARSNRRRPWFSNC